MREFCGSVAVRLPHEHTNIFCFQLLRAWQWQDVAGLCHASKLMKTKGKTGVVADGWQLYIYIYPLGAVAPEGILDIGGSFCKDSQGQKIQRPQSASEGGVFRSTGAFGAVRLCPHHMSKEMVA